MEELAEESTELVGINLTDEHHMGPEERDGEWGMDVIIIPSRYTTKYVRKPHVLLLILRCEGGLIF